MVDDPLIGQQLANFRIERVLGRGGMGQVYYGTDVKLERPVAIKVIDLRYRSNPAYAERFIREARAVATWRHDNIIQIYYADDTDDLYYFVMEYVDGVDLGRVISRHTAAATLIPQAAVLHIGRAVASALDYAHAKGVIHRDVKPANVMVANDQRVVLMDFGLAMDVAVGSQGEVFGTSHYIAPEQARRSADAVPQSDIYALGVMLYELLTGRVPFDDPSATSVALQHLTQPPPPPRSINPALSAEVEAVLLKALAKDAAERYQTGGELLTALEAALPDAAAQPDAPVPTMPTIAPRPPSVPTPVPMPTPPPFNPEASLIGQYLEAYRIEELLGKGGMANIYRGVDVRLKRNVAIKVIDAPFRSDSEYADRFRREAQAIAQLEHPYIVRLYQYGEASGLLYMVMEYIDGVNMHRVLQQRREQASALTDRDLARVIREICAALDYAHAKGVIHRDIKPSNVMLDRQGRAVVADFGLALLTEVGTQGEIFGSPHYVAPEQAISSARVVPQSDLYAVGVIIYELWTGRLPFDAEDPLAIAMLHMSETPPPPRQVRPEVTPQLEAVILKALAKDPADRFATGAELADALEAALQLSMPLGASQPQGPQTQPQPVDLSQTVAPMPVIQPAAAPAPMPAAAPTTTPAPMPVLPSNATRSGAAPLPPPPSAAVQERSSTPSQPSIAPPPAAVSQPQAAAPTLPPPPPLSQPVNPHAVTAPPPNLPRKRAAGRRWLALIGLLVLVAVAAVAVIWYVVLPNWQTAQATPTAVVAAPAALPRRVTLYRRPGVLVLENSGEQAVALENFSIGQDVALLDNSQWNVKNLMPATCIVAVSAGGDGTAVNPAELGSTCVTTVQTIVLAPEAGLDGALQVQYASRVIATCRAGEERCTMEFGN